MGSRLLPPGVCPRGSPDPAPPPPHCPGCAAWEVGVEGWVEQLGGLCRWPYLALKEPPDPVEVGVVVVADHDLQPADPDLGVHRVQQGGVALGQAHHHLCRATGRSGLGRHHPPPSHPGSHATHPGAAGTHLGAGPGRALSGRSSTWRCRWHWLRRLPGPEAPRSTAGRGPPPAGSDWIPETGLARPAVGPWR